MSNEEHFLEVDFIRLETRDAYDGLMNLIPYNRIGEPEDIGLRSDQTSHINGTSTMVDGGTCLRPGFANGDTTYGKPKQ